MEIVNGYTGTDNVTAEMDGGLYASLAGSGKYVLDLGSKLACSVTSANQISIADGGVLINGRYGYIRRGATDTLTVDSGRTGYNRSDLVVAHYHAEAQSGIESLNLEIVKGRESTGLAADPTLTEGNILSGDKDVYLALYRLQISGINLGTPVKLFRELSNLTYFDGQIAELNSANANTNTAVRNLTDAETYTNGPVKFYRYGRYVCGHLRGNVSGTSGGYGQMQFGTLPQSMRPQVVAEAPALVAGTGSAQLLFQVEPNGNIWVIGKGGSVSWSHEMYANVSFIAAG